MKEVYFVKLQEGAKDPSDVLAMNHLFAASTLRNRYRLASDVRL